MHSQRYMEKVCLLTPEEADAEETPHSAQKSVQVEGVAQHTQPPDDATVTVTTETVTKTSDQEPIENSPPQVEASVLPTETLGENKSPTPQLRPSAGWQQISFPKNQSLQSSSARQQETSPQLALNSQPPTAGWQQTTLPVSPHGLVGNTTGLVVQTQPQPYVCTLPPCPNNYLALSIFATLCCCICLGIPAIIYGTKVRVLHQMGNYEGAKQASENAKGFSIAAIIAGVFTIATDIIVSVVVYSAT